jgi:N-glycosidase YbiA
MAITEFQGEYRFLSNFWAAEVYYDSEFYPTVEHAYQAAKTLDKQERLAVLRCRTPGEAKRMSKTLTLRTDWQKVNLGIMEDLVRQKFSIGILRSQLRKTGDQELIEGNTWGDTFWGVCNGKGENHLGKILMKVRAEI